MFGVSEGQYSNPIKAGLSTLRKNGGKFISLNPIRTGYSANADEWVGIRPGSDGKFVLALVHELLKSNRIDLDYIVRYSNLPWLVIQDPGGPKEGLFARGLDGEPLCWDSNTRQTADAQLAGITPSLIGEVSLSENLRAVPAFELMAKRYLKDDFSLVVKLPLNIVQFNQNIIDLCKKHEFKKNSLIKINVKFEIASWVEAYDYI